MKTDDLMNLLAAGATPVPGMRVSAVLRSRWVWGWCVRWPGCT